MRRRRARWRSSCSRTTGQPTSHSSAKMTMAVALRASSMAWGSTRSAPAGRAREEDDAFGVARDLVEGLHHLRLPAPAARLGGHGRPHALVELLAEGRDESFFVLGDLQVAFSEQDLAVPGLHAQELHRLADYATRGPARPMPRTLTGPAPPPSSRKPSRTASDAIARA